MAASPALAIAVFLFAGAGEPVLSLREDVVIDHDRLLLGDIADLSPLPADLRERARSIEIARFPTGKTQGQVSGVWLAARVRAQMPVLMHWLPETSNVTIRVAYRTPPMASAMPASPVSRGRCLVAIAPLAAGESPDPAKFEKAVCDKGRDQRTFRYDAPAQSVRTVRRIGAGEIVPVFADYGTEAVRRGNRLTLVTLAGPVRVERAVEALQSAHQGQQLFARSQDGDVLPVRYSGRGQ